MKVGSISLLMPVLNEEESLEATVREAVPILDTLNVSWELIVIDDGSSDRSVEILNSLMDKDSRIKAIVFTSNFGKSAALAAGAKAATGDVIITFDADGQDDPNEIRNLLDAIADGLDCVSGWRERRMDGIVRRFPSKIANWLIAKSTGVQLKDYGCGLKAYRSEYLKQIDLIGEMHRMTPILVRNLGGRIGEIAVNHRPRLAGQSKYGLSRTPRVIADLLVARFFLLSSTKPMYFFGKFAISGLMIGLLSLLLTVGFKLSGYRDFVETPLPILGMFAIMFSSLAFLSGLLAELIVRIYFRQAGPPYRIRGSGNP
jgi:glycosyltransferase involved in cell wall biosynthesis